jgi:hypothetical protein
MINALSNEAQSLQSDAQRHAAQPHQAQDVLRGLSRLFYRLNAPLIPEYSLPNGRRADAIAISADGMLTIIEIKVSRADLHGDAKWPDYLDYCDQFYWALPPGLDASLLDSAPYLPDRVGLILADRYDAQIMRPAARVPIAPARRKAEMQRIARLALMRMMVAADPELGALHAPG